MEDKAKVMPGNNWGKWESHSREILQSGKCGGTFLLFGGIFLQIWEIIGLFVDRNAYELVKNISQWREVVMIFLGNVASPVFFSFCFCCENTQNILKFVCLCTECIYYKKPNNWPASYNHFKIQVSILSVNIYVNSFMPDALINKALHLQYKGCRHGWCSG